MNLHEHINRTKTLMGLQTLNEGLFKQRGKLKDILRKIFTKSNTATQVAIQLSPYEMKYGKGGGDCNVNGITLMNTSDEHKNNIEVKTQNTYCSIAIVTDAQRPLPTDNTKKSSHVSYLVVYQDTQGTNIDEFYEYFKSVYFIDGQQTDEISQIRTGYDTVTCFTSTLENKPGGCSFSQEMKDKIFKTFDNKNSQEVAQLQSYLNMVK